MQLRSCAGSRGFSIIFSGSSSLTGTWQLQASLTHRHPAPHPFLFGQHFLLHPAEQHLLLAKQAAGTPPWWARLYSRTADAGAKPNIAHQINSFRTPKEPIKIHTQEAESSSFWVVNQVSKRRRTPIKFICWIGDWPLKCPPRIQIAFLLVRDNYLEAGSLLDATSIYSFV